MHLCLIPAQSGHVGKLRLLPQKLGISRLDTPRQAFLDAVRQAAEEGADREALAAEIGATCSAGLQIVKLACGQGA